MNDLQSVVLENEPTGNYGYGTQAAILGMDECAE
jgi:hypothetical protein